MLSIRVPKLSKHTRSISWGPKLALYTHYIKKMQKQQKELTDFPGIKPVLEPHVAFSIKQTRFQLTKKL